MGRISYWRHRRGLLVALSALSLSLIPLLRPAQAAPRAVSVAARDPAYIEPAETLELSGLQRRFQGIASRVAKSVVAISAAADPRGDDSSLRSDSMTPQKLESILSRTTRTVGTGMFIDRDGFVLTNEHVIADAEQLWVTTDDRRIYPAIVIGSDPRGDLAVLKIPATNTQPVAFALNKPMHRGDWTIVLGNPYGLATEGELAMSVGVVSAVERSLPKLASKEGRLYSGLIQTTAEINPGNSGGPLFDIDGRVIGISTAVILPQKSTNGIGFALPITGELLDEVEQLKQGREIVYAFVGVTVAQPTPGDLRAAGLSPDAGGARVDAIEPGSPAAASSIRLGDIIVAVNGRSVRDADAFVRLIGRLSVDAPSSVAIRRRAGTKEVALTPTRRDLPAVAVSRWTQRLRWHGMTLGPIPANWGGGKAEPPGGVYVLGIDDPALCSKLGVKQGAIIRTVAGKVIKSIADLQQVINSTPPEAIKVETMDATTVAAVEQAK